MAEKTAAQKKAQQKYMEKFAVARVRMEREKYEAVQAHAALLGESVNGFIGRAIAEAMARDSEKSPQEGTEGPQVLGSICVPSDVLETVQRAAEAAGEAVAQFISRAVETQAERDKSALALDINLATRGKITKE